MKKQHEKWLRDFLENCKQSNRSPLTIINYRSDLIKYIVWYESYYSGNLNKANAECISRYMGLMSSGQTPKLPPNFWQKIRNAMSKFVKTKLLPESFQRSLKVTTRRRNLSAIKSFYEFLKQTHEDHSNIFPNNPVKSKIHVIKLKDEDVEHTKLLTDKDWHLLDACIHHPRERLITHLLYWGGLRLTELTKLRLQNFNSENESIEFVRKGGSIHKLRLQKFSLLYDLLTDYLAVRMYKESSYLFCNKKGNPISSRAMYTIIMKLFDKAQCPTLGLGPHSFRKACATRLYLQTKDLLFVRDYLNHADAKVTQTYIDLPSNDPDPLPLGKENTSIHLNS